MMKMIRRDDVLFAVGFGRVLLVAEPRMWRCLRRHHIHVFRVKAASCGGLFGLAIDGTSKNPHNRSPSRLDFSGWGGVED
jgi:hypothetical protein